MLKVAHLSPWYWDVDSVLGGAERYVRNLAQAQAETFPEYEVRVRALGRVSKPEVRSLRPEVKLFPQGEPRHDAYHVVSDLLMEDPPDIWHVHQHRSPFGMAALFLLRTLGQRVVVTDLGWVVPWDTRAFRVSDLADAVVAISNYAATRDTTATPQTVIKGGVQADIAAAGDPETGMVFVGRLLPHKGALDLVDAMPSGAPLSVAGAVTDVDYARAVEKICTKKKFMFVPNASDDDVHALRHGAAVGLVPTLIGPGYEYMGLAALEFLAVGRPVVAMNSGGLGEFIEHGCNGSIVESHAEMVSEAVRLVNDPEALCRLRHGALATARSYCCHSVARSLHDVYASVLG